MKLGTGCECLSCTACKRDSVQAEPDLAESRRRHHLDLAGWRRVDRKDELPADDLPIHRDRPLRCGDAAAGPGKVAGARGDPQPAVSRSGGLNAEDARVEQQMRAAAVAVHFELGEQAPIADLVAHAIELAEGGRAGLQPTAVNAAQDRIGRLIPIMTEHAVHEIMVEPESMDRIIRLGLVGQPRRPREVDQDARALARIGDAEEDRHVLEDDMGRG